MNNNTNNTNNAASIFDILESAARQEAGFEAFLNECGKERKTTFFSDFSIADVFGADAIRDTYRRAFNEWKTDVEYFTELVIVLNSKCWQHFDNGDEETSRLYGDLFYDACDWGYQNLKDEDLEYFERMID